MVNEKDKREGTGGRFSSPNPTTPVLTTYEPNLYKVPLRVVGGFKSWGRRKFEGEKAIQS